jgi:ABC-type sugar transport system substrate-binding protein
MASLLSVVAPKKLALFLRAIDNEYQELQRSEFLLRTHLHGWAPSVLDAGNDPLRQRMQVEQALRGGESFGALLVQPVLESGLEPEAIEAARQGIGWVILNRSSDYVRALRLNHAKVPVFCVDPDQTQIGELQGRQILALLPNGGSALYISGPAATSSAQRRLAGTQIALAGAPVRMSTAEGDWTERSGKEATRHWLQGEPPGHFTQLVLVAQNDAMALGARSALLEEAKISGRAEVADVPIVGCDGLPKAGQRWVASGELSATVTVPPTAGVAVDRLATIWGTGNDPSSDIALAVVPFPDFDVLERSMRRKSGPSKAPPQRKTRLSG